MAEQDLQDLEQAAKYRPGAVSQIANLLTGGLYGMASGTTQKSADAERARQALFQENLSNRLMQRRRMESLLDQAADFGIPKQEAQKLVSEDPALLSNRMNEMRVRSAIIQDLGKRSGLAGQEVPFAADNQSEVNAFSLGQLSGQSERFKEERDLDEATKTATALGIPVPQGATSSAIKSLIGQQQGMVPQKAAQEMRTQNDASLAKAYLEQAGQPVPEDSFAAIAAWKSYESGLGTRSQRSQAAIVKSFRDEKDPEVRKTLYFSLTPTQQRNSEIRELAGFGTPLNKEVSKDINSILDRYSKANTAASSIASLVGASNVGDVSQQSFNQLKQFVYGKTSKLLGQDKQQESVRRIVQNFEGLVSGSRKDLFGASLTGNELESAKAIFGDKNSAAFLPTALDFIDSIFSQDKIKQYSDQFDVPKNLLDRSEEQLQKWKKIRSGIKGWKSQYEDEEQTPPGASPAGQPGGTNAPAGTRVLNFDNKGNLIP
jgi:hypothetical protein